MSAGTAVLTGATVLALGSTSHAQSAATAAQAAKTPQATKTIALSINGRNYKFAAQSRETLVNVLRDRIGLTGTKRPCNRSECGGCTVVIDGRAVLSCSALVVELQGTKITTIEGLAKNGTPHPVQKAFADNMGYQCGYCTSGQIMSAYALLTANANPTDDQIMDAMAANLCKCSAYPAIFNSVKAAALLMKNGGS